MASVQNLRSLKIETGACQRLIKDFRFYQTELRDIVARIEKYRVEQPNDKHGLYKLVEMQDESNSVILDVKVQALNVLSRLSPLQTELSELSPDAPEVVEAAAAIAVAVKVFLEPADSDVEDDDSPDHPAEEFKLNQRDSAEQRTAPRKVVTIFGAGRCKRGDSEWVLAEKLGGYLAKAGFDIKTGGYSGTMESAAEGAVAADAQAEAIGVPVPPMFPGISHSPALTRVVPVNNLHERLANLLDTDAFVVLPGMLGTLTELIYVWEHAALARMYKQNFPPIYVCKEPWLKAIENLVQDVKLFKEDFDLLHFVEGTAESLEEVAWKLSQALYVQI